MDIYECLRTRRSSRKFTSEPVSDCYIEQILEAGSLAPSPKNRQPWRYAILKGDEKADIATICRESLKQARPILAAESSLTSESMTFDAIEDAPVLLLVFNAHPDISHAGRDSRFDVSNVQAIGASIQNMLLQATSLGVQSLWICDLLVARERIQAFFPGTGELVAGVILGYSDDSYPRPGREPLFNLVVQPSRSKHE